MKNIETSSIPTSIERETWLDALEALGIPVRGYSLRRVEADARAIRLTYIRRDDAGQVRQGINDEVATVVYDVPLDSPLIHDETGFDDGRPDWGALAREAREIADDLQRSLDDMQAKKAEG